MTIPDTLNLLWFHRNNNYKNAVKIIGLLILYWL
jgi:hypothetical protein